MIAKISFFSLLSIVSYLLLVGFSPQSCSYAQTTNATATSYNLTETILRTIPHCNDTTPPGVLCASTQALCGSFLLSNQTSSNSTTNSSSSENELVTLIHDRGIIFFQPIQGNLTEVNQFGSNCDQLSPLGSFNGNFLLVHGNSQRCTCEEPGQKPCPLQIQVVSPSSVGEFINFVDGSFTTPVRRLPNDIEGQVVLVQAANKTVPDQGCASFANADQVAGKIALIYRGDCFFQDKVDNAEKAGATAVIVVNIEDSPLLPMGVTGNISAVMISFEDGEKIRTLLAQGQNVTLKLGPNTGKIESNPNAASPFGIGSIPVNDIVEGKNLTITPHTNNFEWVNSGLAVDERGFLWVFRVDDDPSRPAMVIDLNSNLDNLTVVKTYVNSPLTDIFPSFFKRGNNFYAIGTLPDGSALQIFNVTDLDNVTLLSEVPMGTANIFTATSNATAIYVGSFHQNVSVIDAFDLISPTEVLNFTEIPDNFTNSNPTTLFVSQGNVFLWVSYGSEGVAVYDIKNPLNPTRVTPVLDTTPQTSNLYTVGVQALCGYAAEDLKAVAVNVNDQGTQEFVRFVLVKATP